jgi:hypothetical protein
MTDTIARNDCVLTGSSDLEHLYTFKNFPIYAGCVDSALPNEDILCDMNWGYSPSSGSVQLLKLLEPDLLYREHHNPGTVGKIWEEHHKKFHNFIEKNGYNDVLEVGGASGCLLNHFLPKNKNYAWTIIEPSTQQFSNDSRIQHIPDFFERHEFDKKYDTLVHSHLFEHVYDPIKFLQKVNDLLEENGKHYITIPNMKYWLSQGYTNTLFFEHTFYIDDGVLEYLLNKTGFEVVEKIIESHSIFIYCKKSSNVNFQDVKFSLPKKLFTDYIASLEKDVKNIVGVIKDRNVYLFGGHIFSQILLNLGLPESQIINILDNDPKKQGKRLYGTNCNIKSPECLKDEDSPIIVLRGGAYTKEIKEKILQINPSAKVI